MTACTSPKTVRVEVSPALRWVTTDSTGRHASLARFRPFVVTQGRPFTLDFSRHDSFQSPDSLRDERIFRGVRARMTITLFNGIALVSGRCDWNDHLGIVASYEQDDESLYAQLLRGYSTRFRGTTRIGHELQIGAGQDDNDQVSLCLTLNETASRPSKFLSEILDADSQIPAGSGFSEFIQKPALTGKTEPPSEAIVYVVAKGDSAAAICRKFQISQEELLANNPGLKVTRLLVGQRVKLPSQANAANLPAASLNYESYPAPSNPIKRFAKTKIPESGIDWKIQDYLRFSGDNPLNFAGKYTLFEIGCGTGCVEFCLIDRTTGTVFPGKDFNQDFPESYEGLMGLQYRQNSSLLVVYHATAFKYPVSVDYYLWDGAKFNLLRSDQIQSRAIR